LHNFNLRRFNGNESYGSGSVIQIINLLIASFQNKYLFKFSCLCDTFGKLNKLNVSRQAPDKNMLDVSDKIAAFLKRLLLWKEDSKPVVKFSMLCFLV